jgi:hypothetical protein
MHSICTPNWFRLVPDRFGSYIDGSWSELAIGDNLHIAPMIGSGNAPDGYGPLFYASAVLPDGRLIVNGGEYENSANGCNPSVDSPKGSLYNPQTNTWSAVPAPPGWTHIGDANSVIIGPNKITGNSVASSYVIGDCCDANPQGKQQAVATIAPIPGTGVTWTITGVGKADGNSEEGWTLLPNGMVLTVDTKNGTHAELFNPSTNSWGSAGNTPVFLGNNLGMPIVPEMGPAVLTGYGVVIQFGANSNTAVFTVPNIFSSSGSWAPGPSFPSPEEVADGPAALLPNGNVLVQTSIGFAAPSLFWEAGGATSKNPSSGTLTGVANPPCNDAVETKVAAFQGRMLVLPTGQILWDAGEGVNCTSVYTPNTKDGSPFNEAQWSPRVTSISHSTLTRGHTYRLHGELLNGVSQGAMYGDDAQMATNYPMVRITNIATGHVCYARTHDYNVGVGHLKRAGESADEDDEDRERAESSTLFDIPPAVTPATGWALVENPCDPGPSTLVLVANGIPSAGPRHTVVIE